MPIVLPPSLLSNGFHRVRGRAPGLLRGLEPVASRKLRFRLAQELTANAHVLFYLAVSAVDLPSHDMPSVSLLPNCVIDILYTISLIS